jgi:hypothetical protein
VNKRPRTTVSAIAASAPAVAADYRATVDSVLRGWQSRSHGPSPKFDAVTGVSTGALQAPFALLGTRAALDTLSAMYLGATDRFAPTIDWFFWLRRTGGVLKTDRYRATVRAVLASQGDALRTEFRDGRQMLVGTTDFDLGIGRGWDRSSADVPGLRMEFRYTAIPDAIGNDPAAAKLFDTPFMRRLETLGYERARSATPWDTAVSPYALPPSTSLP